MPSIRTDKAQEAALNTVTTALNDLVTIDTITQEGWAGSVSLQFRSQEEGRRGNHKICIESDSKDFADVVKLMQARRNRLCKTIQSTAKKYGLILTAEEETLLAPGGKVSPSAPTAEPHAAPETTQTADGGDFDSTGDFAS